MLENFTFEHTFYCLLLNEGHINLLWRLQTRQQTYKEIALKGGFADASHDDTA